MRDVFLDELIDNPAAVTLFDSNACKIVRISSHHDTLRIALFDTRDGKAKELACFYSPESPADNKAILRAVRDHAEACLVFVASQELAGLRSAKKQDSNGDDR